jgi:hypothetical protein
MYINLPNLIHIASPMYYVQNGKFYLTFPDINGMTITQTGGEVNGTPPVEYKIKYAYCLLGYSCATHVFRLKSWRSIKPYYLLIWCHLTKAMNHIFNTWSKELFTVSHYKNVVSFLPMLDKLFPSQTHFKCM